MKGYVRSRSLGFEPSTLIMLTKDNILLKRTLHITFKLFNDRLEFIFLFSSIYPFKIDFLDNLVVKEGTVTLKYKEVTVKFVVTQTYYTVSISIKKQTLQDKMK